MTMSCMTAVRHHIKALRSAGWRDLSGPHRSARTVSAVDGTTPSPTMRRVVFGRRGASQHRVAYGAALLLLVGLIPVVVTASRAGALASEVTAGGSTTAVSTAAVTAVTLSKPTGTAADDVLVASFTADNAPSATAPPGWTSFVPTLKPGNGAALFGYYHVVTTADATANTWTWTLSTAQKWNGGITRFLGVNTTTPLDTTIATAVDNTATATTITVPAITTSTPGAMLIGGLGADGSTPQTTPPATWTQSWQSTGAQIAEQAAKPQPNPGPTGPQTWTINQGRALAAWMTALRPR